MGRSCRLGTISICCTDGSTVSPQGLWDTLLFCQTLSLIYTFVLSKTLLLSSFFALFRPDISPPFCCQLNYSLVGILCISRVLRSHFSLKMSYGSFFLLFFLIFNLRLRDVDNNKLGPVLSADVFAGLSRLDIL